MNQTTAVVTVTVVGLFAIIFFFSKFRGRGKTQIKGPLGMGLKMEGENPQVQSKITPGVKIEDAVATGNIRADDRVGRGAEVKKVKAGGNITATSSSGETTPPKS